MTNNIEKNDVTPAQRNIILHQKWLEQVFYANEAADAGDVEAEKLATRRAQDAGNDLIAANMRLVYALSTRYKINGSANEDLDQAGFWGLWEAIVGTRPDSRLPVTRTKDGTYLLEGGWDPTISTLGTVCRAHVEGRVRRAVAANESRWQGVSYGDWSSIPKVQAAVAKLKKEGVTSPTHAQIAKTAEVTVATVKVALMPTPASLDAPLAAGEDQHTLLDFVANSATDENSSAVLDEYIESVLAQADQLPLADIAAFVVHEGFVTGNKLPVVRTAAVVGMGRGATNYASKRVRVYVEKVLAAKVSSLSAKNN